MSIYSIYRQIHAPTCVEHSVYCHFMSSTERQLVVAGSTEITVYRLTSDSDGPSKSTADKQTDVRPLSKSKLEQLARFSLFGAVQSMQVVRLAGAVRDALVLGFSEAKLSLVEYDPGTHDLKTSSLHYFEEDHLKDGLLQHADIPAVRVDPDNRCAVMTVYGRHLVVLPFKRELIVEESEGKQAGRVPVMSSYTIDLHKLDEKICNVLDIQFLYGYYEPTLLILYEPSRTWTGRIAMRQDTCCIVAISLNITEKVHPIIWSLTNLPYDCHMALAVPRPIGGVLVFAANSLLYLNQSQPPYGVSINSIADISTIFPLKLQEGVRIGLDCCTACFIAYDRLVLSLKGGELYVLTLLADNMRSMRSFNFDKAASSVLTTCVCHCEDGYLFLGSRVGNSLLLKYTEKDRLDLSSKSAESMTQHGPPTKKKKIDCVADLMVSDDLDDLEVYGAERQTKTQHISTYMFEVHDSLLNIGPCGRADLGEPAFLSEEFSGLVDPDLEIVTTSGYGKNGALSVLQRSVRPHVVTTFDAAELAGSYDMWTVVGPPPTKPVADADVDADQVTEQEKEQFEYDNSQNGDDAEMVPCDLANAHAFLLLSKDDSSMVLETGQEIMELDHSGFSTQAPTVYAGNLCNNQYILQVSPMGVRLLQGVKQIQHIPVDLGSPIVHCSVADPYIVIISREGVLMMLVIKEDVTNESAPRLNILKPTVKQKSRILTCCAYKDTSGLFTSQSQADTDNMAAISTDNVHSEGAKVDMNMSIDAERSMTVDDEDDLLYGDADTSSPTITTTPVQPAPSTSTTSTTSCKSQKETEKKIEPTYWMILVRENGALEMYSVPEFKLCFLVKNFPQGHKVLVDSMQMTDQTAKSSTSSTEMVSDTLLVKEILLIGLGHRQRRVHLLARLEEELYMYEAFPYTQTGQVNSHLKIRFKRVAHNLLLQTRKAKGKAKKEDQEEIPAPTPTHVSQLRPFSDVSGYAGVFICGPYPHWLIMTSRGALRAHPMSIDGSVTSFAQFHNINCQKGFLYFNKVGELRISVLPTHLSYDALWPVRKVALRSTPHFIVYHPESKTFMVCTSVQEPCNRFPHWADDTIEYDLIEKDDRYVYPLVDKFHLQLHSPVTWEPVPGAKIDLDDNEHVTCLSHVLLKYEGTLSGMKGYIALGTNCCYGEELTSRGRIMLLEVIEVVPEPGQPLTKNKIKQLVSDEQKGPVTSLTHVCGLLVTAIGQKIYIWQLKDDQLSPVSFIDTQIYIHTMVSVKNMVLASDLIKGITLLRYQQDMRVLSVVSKDTRPVEVYAVNYLIDNAHLGFIATDREKNLCVYSYSPDMRESCGGQWLVRKADIHIGRHINTFFRTRCKLSDPSTDRKPAPIVERRHVTYFATLDGSLGYLLPISEKTYRRLFMLQNYLDSYLPHYAGLNPKALRTYKSEHRLLVNPQKNILDGVLIWKYVSLSIPEKLDLAKRIGTTVQQITDDLVEVDRLTAHF